MTPPKRTAKKAAKKAPAKKAPAKKAPAKKAAKKAPAKKAPAKKPAKKAVKKAAPKKAAAAAPVLISKSRTKEYLKSKGKRSGDDVIQALNAEVYAMLDKASARADGNKRQTLRPTDF